VLADPLPQPFHPGEVAASAMGAAVLQVLSIAAVAAMVSRGPRPAVNRATARRSSADRAEPCCCMRPLVRAFRIDSALSVRSVAGVGADVCPSAWQPAQALAKTAAPSGLCSTPPRSTPPRWETRGGDPDILGRHALRDGRLDRLGATRESHHGLLMCPPLPTSAWPLFSRRRHPILPG